MSSSYDSAVIDTAMIDGPRMLQASRGARLVYFEALVWSKARLTDGFIPSGALRKLTDELDPPAAAAELVKVGLWATVDGGWHCVDYLDTQMSAARVKELREASAKRYDEYRSRHPKPTPEKRVGNSASNGPARPPARPPARAEAEGGESDAPRGLAAAAPTPSMSSKEARQLIDPNRIPPREKKHTSWCDDYELHRFSHRQGRDGTWTCEDCHEGTPEARGGRFQRSLEGPAAVLKNGGPA